MEMKKIGAILHCCCQVLVRSEVELQISESCGFSLSEGKKKKSNPMC